MQRFTQRVLGDQCLELADHVAVAAERQVGLDALLHAREPQLLEVCALDLRERLVGELRKRRPAPQREGLA